MNDLYDDKMVERWKMNSNTIAWSWKILHLSRRLKTFQQIKLEKVPQLTALTIPEELG